MNAQTGWTLVGVYVFKHQQRFVPSKKNLKTIAMLRKPFAFTRYYTVDNNGEHYHVLWLLFRIFLPICGKGCKGYIYIVIGDI
jgi:hypothetical protein